MDAETIRDTRIEIIRFLYGRPSVAMSSAAIGRAVKRVGVECPAEELARQLAHLVTIGHLEEISDDDMPAIKGWQITAAGLNHFEKNHA